MLVYRIGKIDYAQDLSGEGAALYGGRWNHPGTPCIYSSESRALCILEYSANVALISIPRSLAISCIEIPDDSIKVFRTDMFPGNWSFTPHTKEARDFGSKWLNDNNHLVLRVPSAIVMQEFNFLVNPLHKRMKEVRVISVTKYPYDSRVKK